MICRDPGQSILPSLGGRTLRAFSFILALVAAATLARAATAQIAYDLSKHQIEITSGFDGAELLLFGYEQKGAEVVVIVRGPPETISVREKERTAGIWINQDEVTFKNAPSFYFVATTEGLRATVNLRRFGEPWRWPTLSWHDAD